MSELETRASAVEDFHRARFRARLERFLARLKGESAELLCYDDVHQAVKAKDARSGGLQDIPLDAIVGSTGRCKDFTRSFLPLLDEDEQRWAGVEVAATSLAGLPPIDVYKIGDVYFVKDGNHRVSLARQLKATRIQAYVTELHTKVPVSPDDRMDDLIVKAEYAQFLEHTHLDEHRPDADLRVSVPGQYQELEEHISVHRYLMEIERNEPISYEEAITQWYDMIYMPVVQIIREQNLLQDFCRPHGDRSLSVDTRASRRAWPALTTPAHSGGAPRSGAAAGAAGRRRIVNMIPGTGL